jgi:uncharacterized protein YeaO (DUF488 family)
MLFTRSILKDPLPEDGLRISVMSRHTLNDGVTPDNRIKKYDLHLIGLAPSLKLIGSYYKRGLSWNEFARLYKEELFDPVKFETLHALARIALMHDATILCVEDTHEFCHRGIIAEECQKYERSLKVEHR